MAFDETLAPTPAQIPAACAPADQRRVSATRSWLASVLLLLATIIEQCLIGLDVDVSWLLTVGERVLDGQRLYVDIFEVNPPASVLIYLPGIALGRLLALSAEFTTVTLVLILAAATIGWTGRLLLDADVISRERAPLTLFLAFFVLVLLPGACFAQREHIALLTLLPFMGVLGIRTSGRSAGVMVAVLAGLGAGVTMAIKPPFALAVAPMLLFTMWRRRSIMAGLRCEAWAAAAMVLSYGLLVVSVYPVYLTEALPLLNAVYLPLRSGYDELLLSPQMILFFVASAVAMLFARKQSIGDLPALSLIAAFGFAAALVIQGKGYLNHAYPSVALGLFALGLVVSSRQEDKVRQSAGNVALALLGAISAYVFLNVESHAELAQSIERVAPYRPSMMAAASNLSIGHPVTRWVDGQWVGRRGSLWATGAGLQALQKEISAAERVAIAAYIEEDQRMFLEDLERGRPEVVLVSGSEGLEWIASHPDVARAMKPYRRAAFSQDVYVLVRQPQFDYTKRRRPGIS